jgi:hypothetical protein
VHATCSTLDPRATLQRHAADATTKADEERVAALEARVAELESRLPG